MQANKPYTTPLKGSASKFLISTRKKLNRQKTQHAQPIPRFKTEADQANQFDSVSQLTAERRHSTSVKDAKKQYSLPYRNIIKREPWTMKIPNKGVSLSRFNDKRAQILLQKFQRKVEKKPFFVQTANKIKQKDLQCNIIHLFTIYACLLKKTEHRDLVQTIKGYVLQEESDLNQIELCLSDGQQQLLVKQLILNERILLVLLVQSLIRKRYRFNQYNFLQLFKDLFSFYSLLYLQLFSEHIQKLIPPEHYKLLQPYVTQNNKFSLASIRDSFNKKINIILKQFGDIDKFIADLYSKVKEYPSNLLYYNLLQYYSSRLAGGGDWSSWNIEFLETCPSPYIHHQSDFKYTLLLDLDQTLIHYKAVNSTQGEFLLRPYLLEFLRKIEPYYEVGIFTCALKVYADLILDHLPVISFRLYRQHAVKMGNELIKDLSRVGRDISKMILVDNLDKNFKLQKQSGIHVRSWYGDPHDNILDLLAVQLQNLAKKAPEDLRKSNHKRSFL